MKKTLFLTASALALALTIFGASATFVSAQTKQKSVQKKKIGQRIGMSKAREIALQRAAGKVEGGEYEVENGKSVYSFDIRNEKGTITEVQVEAYTGEIVSVEEENAAAEAAEKKEEGKAKHKTKH